MAAESNKPMTISQAGDYGRWGRDLMKRIPPALGESSIVLELGCGDGAARPTLEALGYRWVGVDIAGENAVVRCDGHNLPFPDGVFDLIVTVAVFEHLYDPFAAARELFRVLKPGGVVIGTTAFLEHFHANSYFHMTHLGVGRVFTTAGFLVEEVWSTWHFAESLAAFWIPRQLTWPYQLVATGSRIAARCLMQIRRRGLRQYLQRRGLTRREIDQRLAIEQLAWSGAIGFVARRNAGETRTKQVAHHYSPTVSF